MAEELLLETWNALEGGIPFEGQDEPHNFMAPMSVDPFLSFDQSLSTTHEPHELFMSFENLFENSQDGNVISISEPSQLEKAGPLPVTIKAALEFPKTGSTPPDQASGLLQSDPFHVQSLDFQPNAIPFFPGLDPVNLYVNPQLGTVYSENPSKRARSQSSKGSHRSSSENGWVQRQKKPRSSRFRKGQQQILEEWLLRNMSYPYPQEQDKVSLSSCTGLSVRQVETWFSRTRQRKLIRADDLGLRPQGPEYIVQDDFSDQFASVTRRNEVNPTSNLRPKNQAITHMWLMNSAELWAVIFKDDKTIWDNPGKQSFARSMRYDDLRPRISIHKRSRSCAAVFIRTRTCHSRESRDYHISADQEGTASLDVRQASVEVIPASRQSSPIGGDSDVPELTAWDESSKTNFQYILRSPHQFGNWGVEEWLDSLPNRSDAYNEPGSEFFAPSQDVDLQFGFPGTRGSKESVPNTYANDARIALQRDAEADEKMEPTARRSTRYICNFLPCNMSFSTPKYLSQHEKYHRDGMFWSCTCGHSFYQRDDWFIHLQTSCRRQSEPLPLDLPYSILAPLSARSSRHVSPTPEGQTHDGTSSVGSLRSACGYASFASRRGRRIVSRMPSNLTNEHNYGLDNFGHSPKDSGNLKRSPYQCTFCLVPFSKKYAWRRHEESVHAPQKLWVCGPLPTFGKDGADETDSKRCPICSDTAANHPLCQHDFERCWQKPKEERTFFRKDNLAQHIRLVHGEVERTDQIDFSSWKQILTDGTYDLMCHFCGHENESWDARAKHIPIHFEKGLNMDSWIKTESSDALAGLQRNRLSH